MPSHVDMIISSSDKPIGRYRTGYEEPYFISIKETYKRTSAGKQKRMDCRMMERAGIKNSNNTGWQFWQQHNKPIEIANEKMFAEIVYYIHQNPVASGFVYEAEQWVYSSAKHYAKNDGIIKRAEFC